ncbi:MAG: GTPase HflX, partial [Acidobacteriia bacterium]|nr:GTPase HflX [Terriglobia bacterium]
TVGFIRNLPHTLVSAFRATLEEVQRAALIVQISDATSPIRAEQEAQVEKVLHELESEKKPRLHVVNKIDALAAREREHLRDDEHTVHVSALKGQGLGTLLDRIDHMLEGDPLQTVRLRVPQSEGKALAMLEGRARIYSRAYRDGMVEMEAQAPESVVRKVKKFVVPK